MHNLQTAHVSGGTLMENITVLFLQPRTNIETKKALTFYLPKVVFSFLYISPDGNSEMVQSYILNLRLYVFSFHK